MVLRSVVVLVDNLLSLLVAISETFRLRFVYFLQCHYLVCIMALIG